MHLLFVLLANSADHDKLSLDLQYVAKNMIP